MIGCSSDQAILVARVQGTIGHADAIKLATKACHDIAPPHLLVASAISIARVLGIETFAAVSNKEQLAKHRNDVSRFYFDYDAFWGSLSVKRNVADIYESVIPLPEKRIEQIQRTHRRRTLKKRLLKREISETVATTFANSVMKAKVI